MTKTTNKIKLLGDGYKWATPLFASPIIDPKTEKLFWCAEQYFRWHMSQNREFKKQVQEAVSGKQLLYLTKQQTMKNNEWHVREDWDQVRYKLMLRAQRYKFRYNPLLAQFLLDTGNAKLIYDLQSDDYFGTGKSGGGSNKLSKILEKIREELKSGDLTIYEIENYGTEEKKSKRSKRSKTNRTKNKKNGGKSKTK